MGSFIAHVRRKTSNRRGLAPLELTIALPLFLFILALMIDFAYVAAWKVRGLSVARYRVWQERYPRSAAALIGATGDLSPPINYWWPATATSGRGGESDATTLDAASNVGPGTSAGTAMRGPMIPPNLLVNSYLFCADRGFVQGSASLSREFALLSRRLGSYRLNAHTSLLDDVWQFGRMGLWQNATQRLPITFSSGQSGSDSTFVFYTFTSQSDPTPTANAAQAVAQNYANLSPPMTNDSEFLRYQSVTGIAPPDFYPRLRGSCNEPGLPICFCQLEDAQQCVDRLTGKEDMGPRYPNIPNVPSNMKRRFKSMYSRALAIMTADTTGQYAAEIPLVQQKQQAIPP